MCESRCIRRINPLRKSLTPCLPPLRPLLFRRSNTCKNSHGRWLLHGHLYTYIYCIYCIARRRLRRVCIRQDSGPGWGGGVQVGFRLAGTCILQHRALGDCAGRTRCTGCRDLSQFSTRALAKMTLLGGLYLKKTRVIVARDEVCAPVFISLVL